MSAIYHVTLEAYTYPYPKHSACACPVGAKASINAERSCATDSHLSPISCFRQPPSCAAHPIPTLVNVHEAIPLPGSWHCCGTLPIADPVTRAATAPLSRTIPSNNRTVAVLQRRASRVRDSSQKLVPQACSASNLYPFKLTMPSLAPCKRPGSRHSDHRVHPPSIRHRHLKVLFASSLF